MTNSPASPWANHMPKAQTEHTMPIEEFVSHVRAVTEVLNGRICCTEHGARIAVTVAAACLRGQHHDDHEAMRADLARICSAVIDNLQAGVIRWED